MYEDDVREVINKLSIIEKMYEQIRLVDPILKKVIIIKENTVHEFTGKCFDLWGLNKVCENCISIRAHNENKIFVKVDYTPEKIYVVTAVPIDLCNRRIVIELLQNTTDSLVFENETGNNNKS